MSHPADRAVFRGFVGNEGSTPDALIIPPFPVCQGGVRSSVMGLGTGAGAAPPWNARKKTRKQPIVRSATRLEVPPRHFELRVITPRSRMNEPTATERPDARMPEMPRKAVAMLPEPDPAEATIQEHTREAAEGEAVESGQTAHCSLSALLLVARYLAHGSGPKS